MHDNNGNILTIGFSKSLGFKPFSWAIKWYLNTSYSHTYFKFYSKNLDRNLIYESMGKGTRFISEKSWLKENEQVFAYHLELTPEEKTEFLQSCVDQAGEGYGTLQNIGILISDIFNLNKNLIESRSICSELVGKYLIARGFIFDKDLNLLTPKDIYTALNNSKMCSKH